MFIHVSMLGARGNDVVIVVSFVYLYISMVYRLSANVMLQVLSSPGSVVVQL